MKARRGERDVLKGLVAGLAGGLVASWTMNQFQAFWTKVSESVESAQDGSSAEQQSENGEQQSGAEQDDATVKAATAISEGIFDHKLTKREKQIAGPAVHYAFGTLTGGLYGAVAELAPEVTAGGGLPFGAAFWLVADETAVPLLGLSKAPTEYPLSTHAYALASHFVYGLSAELVRRAVRNAL
jgi:putative membrane protein